MVIKERGTRREGEWEERRGMEKRRGTGREKGEENEHRRGRRKAKKWNEEKGRRGEGGERTGEGRRTRDVLLALNVYHRIFEVAIIKPVK